LRYFFFASTGGRRRVPRTIPLSVARVSSAAGARLGSSLHGRRNLVPLVAGFFSFFLSFGATGGRGARTTYILRERERERERARARARARGARTYQQRVL